MTKAAQGVGPAGPAAALRPCQCACAPSPRHETMPTPVMQTSRAVSAMIRHLGGARAGELLHREGERGRGLLHVLAEFRVGEFDDPEHELGVAGELAFVADLR